MDADYRIRIARPADLAAVAEIEAIVFPDAWSMDALRTSIAGLAFVAETADGQLVGYVFGLAAVDSGEILNLAVAPSHQRRGVGHRLTGAILVSLRAAGVRTVFLEVRASNVVARRFYQRLGFQEVGRRRRYYRRPQEDALVLARNVAGDDVRRTGENGVSLVDKRT